MSNFLRDNQWIATLAAWTSVFVVFASLAIFAYKGPTKILGGKVYTNTQSQDMARRHWQAK